jgi:hypothetical protein
MSAKEDLQKAIDSGDNILAHRIVKKNPELKKEASELYQRITVHPVQLAVLLGTITLIILVALFTHEFHFHD